MILAFLLGGCLLLATGVGAQSPISYQAYLARIGRWRDRVRVASRQEGAACTRILGEVADGLEVVTAVQMPNDSIMAVDHAEIIASLWTTPCDPARADSLLAGICPAQVCPVGQAPINPEDPNLSIDIPFDGGVPPQIGTPPPELIAEIEERLREEESEGSDTAPGGNDGGQPPEGDSDGSGSSPGGDGASDGGSTDGGSGGGSADAPRGNRRSGDRTRGGNGQFWFGIE